MKLTRIATLAAGIAAMLTLCITPALGAQTDSITVTDALKRKVEVEAPVTRVAAFSPFVVDAMLDFETKPVLRPTLPGPNPERWSELETVPFDHSAGPPLESIVVTDPQVIILPSMYARFVSPLERSTGAPVLALDVLSLEELDRNVRTLGRLLGRTADAEQWITTRQEHLETLRENAGDTEPRVFAMFGTSRAFYGFTSNSYLGDLINKLGGSLVEPPAQGSRGFPGLAQISLENIIAADPDVIILVRHATPREGEEGLEGQPAWRELSAVKSGRVITLPDRLFVTCPGSEPTAAASLVAEALRPAALTAADTDGER